MSNKNIFIVFYCIMMIVYGLKELYFISSKEGKKEFNRICDEVLKGNEYMTRKSYAAIIVFLCAVLWPAKLIKDLGRIFNP